MTICFYKEFGELGYLATYSNHGFFRDGIFYKTSEHYYQSKKFDDKKVIDKIINCNTPKDASNIGRDRNNKPIRLWKLLKCDVMFDAVLYKFIEHEDLKQKLINTNNEDIVEETVKENYWGIGPNKDGLNNYGKILCMVRNILKEGTMKYYTREGYELLLNEYHDIDNKIVDTTLSMGKSDEMDSDLRENPEFMELRVKAMYSLPALKKQLYQDIQDAVIIEDTLEYQNWDGTTVSRKCEVTIDFDGEGDEEFTILGYNEGNIRENKLSCNSPLASALYGHKVGDIVTFNNSKIVINNIKRIKEKKLVR